MGDETREMFRSSRRQELGLSSRFVARKDGPDANRFGQFGISHQTIASEWQKSFEDGTYSRWFWEWLEKNLDLFAAFCRLALQARRTGKATWSSAMIVGQMRWESAMREAHQDQVKINENSKSGMARLAMKLYPELEGFFKTRKPPAHDQARRLSDGKLYSEPEEP